MKRCLLFLAMMYPAISLSAQSPVSDGNLIYEITQFAGRPSREAIIIGTEPGFNPSGIFTIPDSVSYKGTNYAVVMLGEGGYGSQYPSVMDGFDGITGVRVPATIRRIANKEFVNCHNIKWYEVAEGNTVYKTDNGSLVERQYDDVWSFFRYPSGATAKTFCVPAAYEYVLSYAFAANNSLKVLQIVGDQHLHTGWQLGNRCIESIDTSNHNRSYTMEDGALYWWDRLEEYCPGNVRDTFTPRAGTTEIANGAFCEAPIREIVLGEETATIGVSQTFMNSDIEFLTLPGDKGLPLVGKSEFEGCRNLKSVRLSCPDNGKLDIGSYAFMGCEALESITFDASIKTIETSYYSFKNCKSLTAFPATSKMKISKLYESVFEGCESMTSFPFICVQDIDAEPSTGFQFAGSGLTQVNWPSVLPEVPHGCFKDCKSLRKVNLKMSTTDIGMDAFAGSGLTALSMMGVVSFYGNSFAGCHDLVRLYFPVNGSSRDVSYWAVPFQADGAQVIVDNPHIAGLDRQSPESGASLYISMVNGGVKIGDGWTKVYVPGRSADLYRNITTSPVTEMYSYDTYPEEGAVVIGNLMPGIKITSVIIEGVEAVNEDGRYSCPGLSLSGDRMNVSVKYTVNGNPMTSTYEWIYDAGVDSVTIDENGTVIWYDLAGRPVDGQSLMPGIYIKVANGRAAKVVVK